MIGKEFLGKYVIARTQTAGVFAGTFHNREGREVHLKNARRIWYWDGAASLSQLAIDGTSKPENCKFPEAVSNIVLFDTIEIIEVSKKAQESIESVNPWKR